MRFIGWFMDREKEIQEELDKITDEYVHYAGGGLLVIDGYFKREELERIIKVLKEFDN